MYAFSVMDISKYEEFQRLRASLEKIMVVTEGILPLQRLSPQEIEKHWLLPRGMSSHECFNFEL